MFGYPLLTAQICRLRTLYCTHCYYCDINKTYVFHQNGANSSINIWLKYLLLFFRKVVGQNCQSFDSCNIENKHYKMKMKSLT